MGGAERGVAAQLDVPLLDLNADSAAAVQALAPFLFAQFAHASPSDAARGGAPDGHDLAVSVLGHRSPSRGAAVAAATARSTADPAPPIWAPARQAFDYTHLGETGADFFSAMVTEDWRRRSRRLGAGLPLTVQPRSTRERRKAAGDPVSSIGPLQVASGLIVPTRHHPGARIGDRIGPRLDRIGS